MPQDFSLEYKYDGGIFPKRVNCLINKDGISLKEQGRGTNKNFIKKLNKKKTQKLWDDLISSKIFEIETSEEKLDKIETIADKSSKVLMLYQNGKSYYFIADKDYGEKNNLIVKQAFDLVEKYIGSVKK